ncbi:hypothetical protein VTH06DRAFT_7191 [Thermothelomyces fergusii]
MAGNRDGMMFVHGTNDDFNAGTGFDTSSPRSTCSDDGFADPTPERTTHTTVFPGRAPKSFCIDVTPEREEEAERWYLRLLYSCLGKPWRVAGRVKRRGKRAQRISQTSGYMHI